MMSRRRTIVSAVVAAVAALLISGPKLSVKTVRVSASVVEVTIDG